MKTVQDEKHFTVSIWIITKKKPAKILLVHHKKFNKWIQPGGHIEKFENPIDAIIRETKEETGLNIGFFRDQIRVLSGGDKFLPIPKFLQEQVIPAYGKDPEHFHLDISYVVKVEEQILTHDSSELNNIGWFAKKEALKLSIHDNTKLIIRKLL